jgi:hypothetical protein
MQLKTIIIFLINDDVEMCDNVLLMIKKIY